MWVDLGSLVHFDGPGTVKGGHGVVWQDVGYVCRSRGRGRGRRQLEKDSHPARLSTHTHTRSLCDIISPLPFLLPQHHTHTTPVLSAGWQASQPAADPTAAGQEAERPGGQACGGKCARKGGRGQDRSSSSSR